MAIRITTEGQIGKPYQEGQVVIVVTSRERSGVVRTHEATITRLGKDRVTVKFNNGSKSRVAYSSISLKHTQWTCADCNFATEDEAAALEHQANGHPDEEEKALDTALEALHVAAAAIRQMDGVTEATADNDHKSGEVIFSAYGHWYCLSLKEFEPDEEEE